jgi:hypothetical protein
MCVRQSRRRWLLATLACITGLGACTSPEKVALAKYAPQSSDADIEAVSLSASEDDTFDPERVGTEFPDTTRQVAVWYRWDDADSGKKVGIRWTKNGEVVLEQGDTLAKASGASAYVLKMAAGSKLPIGDYQVELLENGVAVTKIPFTVGDGAAGELAGEPQEAGVAQSPAESTDEVALADTPAESGEVEQMAVDEPVADTTPSAAQPETPPAGPPALAVQQTKWPGVVLELTEFVRKGNTLNAKLRFTNKGSKQIRPDFYYTDTYVLDADNKKYEVLKDDKGAYLASLSTGYNSWWGEYMDPGTSRTVWMRFQAPPGGTSAVTLQLPGVDPFEDVRAQN